MTPDRVLHDRGWAVRFDGCGALEGPKYWEVSGQPMGCMFGRHIKVRAPSGADIHEAAALFVKAIEDNTGDVEWTEEDIQDEICKCNSKLNHFRWMLTRRQKGLDIYGIERDPDE